MTARPGTTLVLVLHGHMPAVVGHGTWPHGAEWLHEAAAGTYIPFVRAARQLAADGVPFRATVGLTPVLCEQLADSRFVRGFRRYLGERARAAARDGREIPATGEGGAALAETWRARYLDTLAFFEGPLGRDLVGAFRELARSGSVELISSAATHGFLPLLPSDRAVERQLDVGLAAHRRHFGQAPSGFWLPECAWRPDGDWTSPATGRSRPRPGLARFLVERGIRYTFVETHLVTGGPGPGAYGVYGSWGGYRNARAPQALDTGRSPYRPYAVSGTEGRLAVFGRDPRGSEQVWSGLVGYPGDGAYLDFHRKRSTGGLRYWRVTDCTGALEVKQLYDPTRVPGRLEAHAEHFCSILGQLAEQPGSSSPVAAAMFDFELFGHWWFEGIAWLETLFRTIREKHPEIRLATASEVLSAGPPTEEIPLLEGSWGKGGDFRVWRNDGNTDYWRRVDTAERHLDEIARADPDLLPAARRQALLLQSSDWPFLVEGGAASDYALRRIRGHSGVLRTLAAIARRRGRRSTADEVFLEGLARQDTLFGPELDGRGPTSGREAAS